MIKYKILIPFGTRRPLLWEHFFSSVSRAMPPPSPSQYWIALDLLDRPQKLNCTTFFLVGYIMNLFTIGIYITYITLGRIIIVKSIQNFRNCQNCRRRKKQFFWHCKNCSKMTKLWFVANLILSQLRAFFRHQMSAFYIFGGGHCPPFVQFFVRACNQVSLEKSLLQPQNPTLHCTNLISCTF